MVLACKSIASILAAGCCVVFKASELCPRTHHWLLEAYTEAGVPPGVLNVIQARREDSAAVTESLVAHKAIKKVEFIGSAVVGRKIASLCGRYLKPVLMELGGKCASIVLEDANLEDAAAKCINAGSLSAPLARYKLTTKLLTNCLNSLHPPRPGVLFYGAHSDN